MLYCQSFFCICLKSDLRHSVITCLNERKIYSQYTANAIKIRVSTCQKLYIQIVKSYLLYGIQSRLRFYPECLVSIVPRLFCKLDKISSYQFMKMLYNNEYKHGFCTDLNDPVFNKYYKMITWFTHVSVNYNRKVLKLPNN